jgi:hypothetical protein
LRIFVAIRGRVIKSCRSRKEAIKNAFVDEFRVIEGDGKIAGLPDAEKYQADRPYNVAPVIER